VQKEVKKRGAIIDNNAVSYLVEAIGNDLWRLNNELDKLSSYTKRITMQDADLFIDSPLDDNIFNFTDAISNQDTRKALRLLHDQLDSGANEFMLISMLARQIKILIQVKETKGQGLDLHPFVIKKALAQINKFSLESLKKLFTQLSNIDYKLKNSQGSPRLLLDLFTVEMCAKQEYN
jgi:DNA polymerase-3 subunit delta